ncbi:MAG: FG-GAP-like repeat-containing protein [bacterium]
MIFALLLCTVSLLSGVELFAVIEGPNAVGRFGDAIAAGDLNADGFPDLFIGEPAWSRVWCFLGGADFDTTADLVFTGTAGTQFGACLTSADINGDGFFDLIVGAPRDNAGGAIAGRCFIFFGDTLPSVMPGLILTGHNQGGRFASALAAGDINGDRVADLLIGAPGEPHAYLFFGGSLLDTIPDLLLHDGNGDYFGGAVAALGDVNLDSFGDILVGDYRHTGPILHGGGCFLYSGGNPPDPILDQLWEGDENNYQLGITIANPGDLNGDRVADLVFASSYSALVEIRFGGHQISIPADVSLRGELRFGSALSGGYDFNGDGFDDLLVGADGDDYGTVTGPGYAYLFLGGNPFLPLPETVLVGENEGDMLGSALAFLGDLNGDGKLEFAVGAPGFDGAGPNSGRVYLYSRQWTGLTQNLKTAPPPSSPATIVAGKSAKLQPGGRLFDITGRRLSSTSNPVSAVYFQCDTKGKVIKRILCLFPAPR